MIRKKQAALFGFGCVGQGLFEIIQQLDSLPFTITKICVKDKNKTRSLSPDILVFDKKEILENDEIDIIVEAINDDSEALDIAISALNSNKIIISASKKMLAENLPTLTQLEAKTNGTLLYESSTCGSIPIITTLQDYFRKIKNNDLLGILNGSSNFVLSKIFNEDLPYETALKEAQDLGFAETDPTLDVGGFDASHKLSILAYHAFQANIELKQIFKFGIEGISPDEVALAKSRNGKIKQVAILKRLGDDQIIPLVMPALVTNKSPLYNIEEENNAVLLDNDFTGLQLFQGKGAGSLPTGWAVFADLLAACKGYKYVHSELNETKNIKVIDNVPIPIYLKCKSDEVIKSLAFQVEEDLSTDTLYRVVRGRVLLSNLHELIKFNNSQKLFLFLDLDKFIQENETVEHHNNKALISV